MNRIEDEPSKEFTLLPWTHSSPVCLIWYLFTFWGCFNVFLFVSSFLGGCYRCVSINQPEGSLLFNVLLLYVFYWLYFSFYASSLLCLTARCLAEAQSHAIIHSFIHSEIHSVIHSDIQTPNSSISSLTHSFIRSFSCREIHILCLCI